MVMTAPERPDVAALMARHDAVASVRDAIERAAQHTSGEGRAALHHIVNQLRQTEQELIDRAKAVRSIAPTQPPEILNTEPPLPLKKPTTPPPPPRTPTPIRVFKKDSPK